MNAGRLLYEGKAKIVYETDDPSMLLMEFKNDATAFDGKKKGSFAGKGKVCNLMSASLFSLLEHAGVRTHYIRTEGERFMLVRRMQMLPVEVVVRNVAAGSISRRLGIPEGTALPRPLVEFYYKNDSLGDPLLCEGHIEILKAASPEQVEKIKRDALAVDKLLMDFFSSLGVDLIDFKLEFGMFGDEILLGDEISPDTCRLWDAATGDKLDKDRFRRDLGGVEEAYAEMLSRVESGSDTVHGEDGTQDSHGPLRPGGGAI
ncbi:MAG: phosphoribosylaminoimidazolesuccinocarboxamide synthase [Clostridia bacterium]|nr:phosphoribosylaminoimidazolesuccinocarboxamide synthase [Clostridia bacterium]